MIFPCRIASSMHLGCGLSFGKLKVFTLSKSNIRYSFLNAHSILPRNHCHYRLFHPKRRPQNHQITNKFRKIHRIGSFVQLTKTLISKPFVIRTKLILCYDLMISVMSPQIKKLLFTLKYHIVYV